MILTKSWRDEVNGVSGFDTSYKLQPAELHSLKGLIEAQWLDRIGQFCPDLVETFRDAGLDHYHKVDHLIDHSALWTKVARVLEPDAVRQVRRMPLMQFLEAQTGPFQIADEEELGHENIYWRIVRPDRPTDVGPLHADCWFWELGKGKMPAGLERIKVWVAIACEPGPNGLRVVPGSHRRQWRYHGELRGGMLKPQIDEDVDALNPLALSLSPGDAIVFHDRLLHGGVVNRGSLTRVSIEFTMLVRPL